MTTASSPEIRPLDLDTPAFSTRFDRDGLTIRSTPYRGGELVWMWLMLCAGCGLLALYFLDSAAPSLGLLARFRTAVPRPAPWWLAVPLVCVPACVSVWYGSRLAYRVLGRERVHMDTAEIAITKSLFGVSRTRRYPMDEIRWVRAWGWSRPYWSYAMGIPTNRPPRGPFGSTEARRIVPSHPGGLFFIWQGAPVRFLTSLRPGPAVEVLKVISRIWPRLIAPSEGTRVAMQEWAETGPISSLNDTSPW